MAIENLSKLPRDNIGIAQDGRQKNCYVHVEKYTDTAWLLYWVKPYSEADNPKVGVDVGDDLLGNEEEALHTLNHYLRVDWLSDAEAKRVYLRYFNFKESTSRSTSNPFKSIISRLFRKKPK
jgi:hypothetical protein